MFSSKCHTILFVFLVLLCFANLLFPFYFTADSCRKNTSLTSLKLLLGFQKPFAHLLIKANCLKDTTQSLHSLDLTPYVPQAKAIYISGPELANGKWEQSIDYYILEVFKRFPVRSKSGGKIARFHFKILSGKLYIRNAFPEEAIGKAEFEEILKGHEEYKTLRDMLLATLYLYGGSIRDIEFIVDISSNDSYLSDDEIDFENFKCNRTDFVMGMFMEEGCRNRGFTLPSLETYRQSWSFEAMDLYHTCILSKYPYDSKIPKVVWRGQAVLDTQKALDRLENSFLLQDARAFVGIVGKMYPELLDAGFANITATNAEDQEKLMQYAMLFFNFSNPLPDEDFNKYIGVIDVDEGGWSKRLPSLMHSNTPILKQLSVINRDHISHSFTHRKDVLLLTDSLSNLLSEVAYLIDLYKNDLSSYIKLSENMHQIAKDSFSHTAVLKATAYALANYAIRAHWDVSLEDDYREVPFREMGGEDTSLPSKFISAIRNS